MAQGTLSDWKLELTFRFPEFIRQRILTVRAGGLCIEVLCSGGLICETTAGPLAHKVE